MSPQDGSSRVATSAEERKVSSEYAKLAKRIDDQEHSIFWIRFWLRCLWAVVIGAAWLWGLFSHPDWLQRYY